jgi:hypothetical protein
MRGRALLSDEVGLGKTIEAGLVLKECLTRGLVRRFLILTMPSLVDQWQEEPEEKFGTSAVTTNSVLRRDAADEFGKCRDAVIASLHTVNRMFTFAMPARCRGTFSLSMRPTTCATAHQGMAGRQPASPPVSSF